MSFDARARSGNAEYANMLKVGYNAIEFLFDFGQSSGPNTEHFHTRIVAPPACARLFLQTVQEAVSGYEKSFGPIPPLE